MDSTGQDDITARLQHMGLEEGRGDGSNALTRQLQPQAHVHDEELPRIDRLRIDPSPHNQPPQDSGMQREIGSGLHASTQPVTSQVLQPSASGCSRRRPINRRSKPYSLESMKARNSSKHPVRHFRDLQICDVCGNTVGDHKERICRGCKVVE